jgi:hypothetical protein
VSGYDDIENPAPTEEELLEAEVRRYTRQRLAQRIAREREAEAMRDAAAPGFAAVDVAAVLAEGIERERPQIGQRSDGLGIFYGAKVNCVWGPPESGKTLLCLEVIRQVLNAGGKAVYIDADANGEGALIANIISRGVSPDTVSDPSRFLLFTPRTGGELAAAVRLTIAMNADFVVIDNNGKALHLLGLRQNEGDDHGYVQNGVYQPIADSGAALVYIDHTTHEGGDGRSSGIGTVAKYRDFSGVSYFVKKGQQFDYARGGHAHLLVTKDRPGGIRDALAEAGDDGRQFFATYAVDANGDGQFHAPRSEDSPTRPTRATTAAKRQQTAMTDAEKVREHFRTKPSIKAVKAFLGCGQARAESAIGEAFG